MSLKSLRRASLLAVFLSPILSQNAVAQVVAEDSKLGTTPGLHLKIEKESQTLELQTEPVQKDLVIANAEYTFNRRLLLGVRFETGSVTFRGTESETGGNAMIFGKALLWRDTWRGGLQEASLSVETSLNSPDSPASGVWGLVAPGSLAQQQLWIGSAAGSTRATFSLYLADGPLSVLLGSQYRLNRSVDDIKLGDSISANFGVNRYLLPYGRSKWQIIGGFEAQLDLRRMSIQSGSSIPGTGGAGLMASPTLRVVVTPNVTVLGALTFPVAESYGDRELVEKRTLKAGLSVSF